MRVIVAGSRHCKDYNLVERAIAESGFHVTEIVSGGAPGIDSCGQSWAKDHQVTCVIFPAEWGEFGLKAGPIRNSQMSSYGEALVLIWDGFSPGSADMKKKVQARNLPIYEKIIPAFRPIKRKPPTVQNAK